MKIHCSCGEYRFTWNTQGVLYSKREEESVKLAFNLRSMIDKIWSMLLFVSKYFWFKNVYPYLHTVRRNRDRSKNGCVGEELSSAVDTPWLFKGQLYKTKQSKPNKGADQVARENQGTVNSCQLQCSITQTELKHVGCGTVLLYIGQVQYCFSAWDRTGFSFTLLAWVRGPKVNFFFCKMTLKTMEFRPAFCFLWILCMAVFTASQSQVS
jgi:hypothetical protein